MTSENGGTQLALLPKDQVPKPRLKKLDPDELPPTPSAPDYLPSMREHGFLFSFPIVLVEDPTEPGGFRYADGRRRAASAKAAKAEDPKFGGVYALIYPEGTPSHVAASLTLISNLQRSSSPANELAAIEELMEGGASEQDVARALGLNLNTIRKRLKLAKLVDPLRDALDEGLIAASVAEKASTLDTARQTALVEVLQEKEKLTGADVREAKEARKQNAVSALPENTFESPEAPEPTAQVDGPAVKALWEIVDRAPDEEPEYGDWGGDTERAEQWGIASGEWEMAQIARRALIELGQLEVGDA